MTYQAITKLTYKPTATLSHKATTKLMFKATSTLTHKVTTTITDKATTIMIFKSTTIMTFKLTTVITFKATPHLFNIYPNLPGGKLVQYHLITPTLSIPNSSNLKQGTFMSEVKIITHGIEGTKQIIQS